MKTPHEDLHSEHGPVSGDRLARATSTSVRDRRAAGGGALVAVTDPSGIPVRVVADVERLLLGLLKVASS